MAAPRPYRAWKVVPDGRYWIAHGDDAGGARSRHEDRDATVREAQLLAERRPPGHVIVHGPDGGVVWSAVYAGPRPAEEEPTSRPRAV